MSLLQAYRAKLLADLDEGRGIGPNAVCKLRRATDLSLSATKERVKTIGRSYGKPWWPLRDMYG